MVSVKPDDNAALLMRLHHAESLLTEKQRQELNEQMPLTMSRKDWGALFMVLLCVGAFAIFAFAYATDHSNRIAAVCTLFYAFCAGYAAHDVRVRFSVNGQRLWTALRRCRQTKSVSIF
jgi:hypothetical protein